VGIRPPFLLIKKFNIMKTRFGMLMVDAVGKAGGQCIQRRGSIRVLRNITIPTQRSASTQNPQRFVNNYLFSAFSNLSQQDRDLWREVGSNLNVKNTWGEDKTLLAREAFLKCNGTLYPASGELVNPNNFDYTTPSFEVSSLVLSSTGSLLTITTAKDLGGLWFQIKALKLRSKAVNPNVSKLRTASYQIEYGDADDNYMNLIKSTGPVQVGDVFSIAVRAISESGLTSLYSQFQVTAV
jgi:hypothetical protein